MEVVRDNLENIFDITICMYDRKKKKQLNGYMSYSSKIIMI